MDLNAMLLTKAHKEIPVVDSNVVFLSHFDNDPPVNMANGQKGSFVNYGYYQSRIILTDPASAKFGQGFLKGGGSVGGGATEYLQFPKGFTFGTRNWTIEGWFLWDQVFSASGATQYCFVLGRNTTDYSSGLILSGTRYNNGFTLDVNTYNSVPAKKINILGLNNAPADKYFHLATVRDGNDIRVYLNGKMEGSGAIGPVGILEGNINMFGIASNASQPGTRTDEVRIVMDQVLYTSNFTPPSGPFPDPVIPPT